MNRFLKLTASIILLTTSSLFALPKTNGTPIGGMGTGYVVYNAVTGEFGTSSKAPPAGAAGYEFSSARKSSSAGFYFFANGESTSKAKTDNEDAKCPIYTADFKALSDVEFSLVAFGPFIPGDDPENFKLATSPLAYFQISAVNKGSSAANVAVALEFANVASSGQASLIGGATSGTVEGKQAISYAGSNDNAYLSIDCDGKSPEYSSGAKGDFTTKGTLANSDGNFVGAKCEIAPNDTVRFKFTLAWWRKFESGSKKENFYYHNNFDNSKEASEYGRKNFDAARNGIVSFVERTMASNFPEWYKDRLLNNTYPLTHNSQIAKDGRTAFWEGKYGIIGTIDQGQHASLFYSFNWPQVQWQELQFWKRTAKQNGNEKGQIHHDFNEGVASFSDNSNFDKRFLCEWDDHSHPDYWWFPNTSSWSDLNSMFIFKAYELMLATGKKDSIKTYFPAIKTTADRILVQAGSNSVLPLNSHSTYDESNDGGRTFAISPEYCGGVALTTYLAVVELAKFIGEDSVAQRFKGYYDKGRKEFESKFLNDKNFGSGKDYSEGDVAGYSWANYFCLEPIMDSAFITSANSKLWNYYKNRTESGVTSLRSKLGKWGFYTCDHWGGVEIAIGKPDTALIIHGWDHQYYYKEAPNMVFWQNLRKEETERSNYASYMTGPTVWRSYFQMIGYMIDNANKRLWIRPRIPSEMNKKIENAILLNTKCLGTLNYDENKVDDKTQSMNISYDKPVSIKEIMLNNNTGKTEPGISIKLAGKAIANFEVSTEGSGYEKNIRITFSDEIEIGPEGVKIDVFAGPVSSKNVGFVRPANKLSIGTKQLRAGSNIYFTIDKKGPVKMELVNLNGARIGVIMQKNLATGNHSFKWNGVTSNGKPVGSVMALLRVSTAGSTITSPVFILN